MTHCCCNRLHPDLQFINLSIFYHIFPRQEYDFSITLRQKWNDQRLRFEDKLQGAQTGFFNHHCNLFNLKLVCSTIIVIIIIAFLRTHQLRKDALFISTIIITIASTPLSSSSSSWSSPPSPRAHPLPHDDGRKTDLDAGYLLPQRKDRQGWQTKFKRWQSCKKI